MKLYSDKQRVQASPDQFKGGECLLFDLEGTTQVGLALSPADRAGNLAFIALSPGGNDYKGRPGVIAASAVYGRPWLYLGDAMAVPSTDLSKIHMGLGAGAPKVGALWTINGDVHISAMSGQDLKLFSLSKGERYKLGLDLTDAVWYSEWSIGVPTPSGGWDTLCTIKAA